MGLGGGLSTNGSTGGSGSGGGGGSGSTWPTTVTTVTGPLTYNVGANSRILYCNSNAGDVTITASGAVDRQIVVVYNGSSNNTHTVLDLIGDIALPIGSATICQYSTTAGTWLAVGGRGAFNGLDIGNYLKVTSSSRVDLDSGTAAFKAVVLDSSARLPAVSGALLTSLTTSQITDFVAAVQAQFAQFDTKQPVQYATAAALPSNVYANGASGVGATLTGSANGALAAIDGVTITTVGTRILVKNEATPANNGVYTLTQVGVPAVSKYILTRATDSDLSADLGAGILVTVEAPAGSLGVVNNSSLWVSLAASPFTTGTTGITFAQVGVTGAALTANNLSDLASASTARTNLGLGSSATAALDSTSTDIKPPGTQAAGGSGKVPDASHVHPGGITQVNATNATWPIPAGATQLNITAVGGGGQGGGGGTVVAAAVQAGGAGGGAGGMTTQIVSVGANTTLNITIGAGGSAAGGGGAAGANPGIAGSVGTNTTVTGTGISITAAGGGGGAGSAATSSASVNGGLYAKSGTTGNQGPGFGGSSAIVAMPGIGLMGSGGGGAGPSTTSLGGGGGGAGASGVGGSAGGSGASGTSAGVSGTGAAANSGSGGGGGGGATNNSGAGGNGGAGGSGFVVIEVIG